MGASTLTVMEKARGRMLYKHMFFATIILGTPFIEDENIPTAQTNMKCVWYNPKFINMLPLEVVMFVIAHEVFHIILKHGLRRGSRDPDKWNRACDYAINLQLQDYGFIVWEHCLIDEKYRGMTAEQIYNLLPDEPESGGGDGEGEDGIGRDLTNRDINPEDQAERAQIEQRIDQMVAQAATAARQAGQMQAGLELLVDGIINPPLPWLAMFVDYMTRFVNDEETWSRRHKAVTNYIVPSRRNPGMGPIGVIGDTSASMLIYRVWAQVSEELTVIAQTVRPEFIQVIWADYANATREERFERGDEIVLHPKGGGGTDMRMPLKHMEQYEPEVVILITDCETPWPTEPTPYHLIVLSTTNHPEGSPFRAPSWANSIQIR